MTTGVPDQAGAETRTAVPDLAVADQTADRCADVTCNDDDPCTADGCDPATGACTHAFTQSACDDHNACTTNDRCHAGTCSGEPVSCDDANPCTTDACDAQSGCLHAVLDGVLCDDGDPCTKDDACDGGLCGPGTPVTCGDDNPCTDDACDAATGACRFDPVNDGTPCDDGNACSLDDVCLAGLCSGGAPLVCDDGNACTTDLCEPGQGCVYQPNALVCDDANPCTQGDSCKLGKCVSGAPKTCADGNPCTLDTCAADTGECVHTPNDWPCDDANACTTGDTCQAGVCTGAAVSCDDANPCTADSCLAVGGCQHVPVAAACDDGNPCTVGDVCAAGICQPGPGMLSCDDGNPCTDDVCDPAGGTCAHTPNQAPCDDSNLCTTGDQCAAGTCVAGSLGLCQCQSDADCAPFDDGNACNGQLFCDTQSWPFQCKLHPKTVVKCSTAFDTQCARAECQPASGLCILTPVKAGTPCDDGDYCTLGDICLAGDCVPLETAVCDDQNPCTDEACEPDQGCVYSANSLPCDDGNLCTLGDLCVGGNCIGEPVFCEDGNPCTVGVCQPDTGLCAFPEAPGSCNDLNPCTENDQCAGGLCLGEPRDCEDGLACTADACEPATGCVHEPLAGECDDGNDCTVDDSCSGLVCKGTPVVCNDGNPCTDDFCLKEGGCQHPPNVAPCDDSSKCTYGDQCSGGECTGLPVKCDDGNPCTTAYCHPDAGCIVSWLDIPCTDVNPCTLGDWCIEGVCIPGTAVVCDDGNPCTVDYCEPATGECVSKPIGSACDDGSSCTTGDLCVEGVCTGFPVSCEDLNPCTSDSCLPDQGCVHEVLDGVFCDDGDPCTVTDACADGECVGTGIKACDDGTVCTADACVPKQGCVYTPVNDIVCDDADPATVADRCQGGTCTGLPDADLDGIAESGWLQTCAAGLTDQCNDNCPGVVNPAQDDGDGDGIGDLCEQCGAPQPIDGDSPPDPVLWETAVLGDCPAPASSFEAATTPGGEDYLGLTALRGDQCQSGTVRVTWRVARDLHGETTSLRFDLEWRAAVYPFAFLGTDLARLSVTDGDDSVVLYAPDPTQSDPGCGTTAVPAQPRHEWQLNFDAGGAVTVTRDGEPLPDSPFDLTALDGHWYIEWTALSGDLLGDCGATAALRLFAFEVLCEP